MNNNEYASKKLKKLRNRKNLTQGELAEELGVTQQQIARYENGNGIELKEQTMFIPVYDGLNFKKTDEYIELPKSWFKNKNSIYCVKLNGETALYRKGESQYIVFEKD